MRHQNSFFPWAASAFCGLAVYLSITIASGRNEAWDSGSYYVIGIPFMCIAAFTLGRLYPTKAWRWALGMALGQAVGAVFMGSSLALLPFALVFMIIISIPQLGAALIGAKLGLAQADP